MSLDLDYLDKVKNSDLKNILREKLDGYPQVEFKNQPARKETPPPVKAVPSKGAQF
jgi:hypothetical protein